MHKRILFCLLFVGLLAIVPGRATDFHYWRTDGVHIAGSSIGQQSSNLGFNVQDSLTDPGATNLALFWQNELQGNGGQTRALNFGDQPPTSAIKDNREQDPIDDWNSWRLRSTKAMPQPVPTFTPFLPQAWGPVVADLSTSQIGVTDDFLLTVAQEPVVVDLDPGSGVNLFSTLREQIINVYYPQTANDLPGNDSNANTPQDRGTVRPLWIQDPANPGKRVRQGGIPGLRLRDLAPLDVTRTPGNPGLGVVTQQPILARVPAVYRNSAGQTVSEIHTVVYLVSGTGENGDQAQVICLRLDRALPDPANPPALGESLNPPNDRFFNPNGFDPNNAAHGDVMWSFPVTGRAGGITPVAGISFANIGTSSDSRPILILTTADGQIICLNAKSADLQTEGQDGDPAIQPVSSPPARWRFQTVLATDMITTPGFHYGMAPAVVRASLSGLFDAAAG
ncbi:MAG: hypothetical protein FJX77_15415, partial [Armatimonadetes bacterium]|nr:hypothetical protein [Armatimonadota bacterium]